MRLYTTHTPHVHAYTHSHTHTVGSFLAGWPFSFIIQTYTWNDGYLMIEVLSATMCVLSSYLVVLVQQVQPVGND